MSDIPDDNFFEKQRREPDNRTYSEGKIHPNDEGDIAFRIAADPERNVIVLEFAKPVLWIALPPALAKQLSETIARHLEELRA